MISYLNTHLALEQRRVLATQNNGKGPRVSTDMRIAKVNSESVASVVRCRISHTGSGFSRPSTFLQVLIVGPNDVGKTSLSKMLLSYALRQSRQPIYVDLDCSEVMHCL